MSYQRYLGYVWLPISSQTSHQSGTAQVSLLVSSSICLCTNPAGSVYTIHFYKRYWKEAGVLAILFWAARWSYVRTLNYSAIPQQIEAVMHKATWLASSRAGEHQWTSPSRYYSVYTGYATPHTNFTNAQFRPGSQFTAARTQWFFFFPPSLSSDQTQSVLCFHREEWVS